MTRKNILDEKEINVLNEYKIAFVKLQAIERAFFKQNNMKNEENSTILKPLIDKAMPMKKIYTKTIENYIPWFGHTYAIELCCSSCEKKLIEETQVYCSHCGQRLEE